ncbi:hypothetical protein GCM10022233_03560 [Streptomyces shaanxiensis]|uniref:Uncharacterized protein n=1 Tax=Streptomyces shaanxiensis TaxID=653357 RepID=A0ABP7U9N5_9ACTN
MTNALYRDRMSASAVGAAALPVWQRPQQSSYGCGSPQGQAVFVGRCWEREVRRDMDTIMRHSRPVIENVNSGLTQNMLDE